MSNKILAAFSKFNTRLFFIVIGLFLTFAIGLALRDASEALNLNLSNPSGVTVPDSRSLDAILNAESRRVGAHLRLTIYGNKS